VNTDRRPEQPGELWKYVTIDRKEMVVLVTRANVPKPKDRPAMGPRGPWAVVLILDDGGVGGVSSGTEGCWPVRQEYGEDGGWKRVVP
jgi:hypothetical protein